VADGAFVLDVTLQASTLVREAVLHDHDVVRVAAWKLLLWKHWRKLSFEREMMELACRLH